MEQDDLWLNDLARAILDGTPVDLDSAGSDASDSRRAAVRQAQILARIAELHRSMPAEPDTSLSASGDDTTAQLTSWGRLTIVEEIGHGAFGAVYRAKDPRLDRDVALKLLRPHAGLDSDRLAASVIEEGRLLARVHHPNVVAIYDADQIAGRVGLTMEFVRGRTLAQALHERGPFSPAEVVAIGIEVCRALAAVHQAGLLHRDIKAQNVMRQDDGRLVLMDFGAGRELNEESGVAADMAGTPLYLAPEIFDGQPATVQSDVYSVAVLLYHLLTGGYPVTGRTIRDVREGHRRNWHVSLRDAGADVPDALARAIDRALEAKAADRYASPDEMASALAAVDAPAPVAFRWHWLAAGAALLAASGVTWALLGQNLRQAGSDSLGSTQRPGVFAGQSPVNVQRLDLPNLLDSGQLSQDGKYLPYSDSYEDGPLKLLEVATGKTRNLASDPGRQDVTVDYSIVSPDDGWVAYSWESGKCNCTELRIVDTQGFGNPPRVLVHEEKPGWIAPMDWSRDGTEILAVLWRKDHKFQIALVSTQDGTVRVLKAGLEDVFSMRLSPDGRYVAFDYPVAADNYARDISALATDGSGEIPLVQARSHDAYPMWTPDGRGVVFASDRSGTLGLWLAPTFDGQSQGAPEILRKDMGRIRPISITRDGTLFYQLQSGAVDVYTARVAPDGTIVADSVAQAGGSFLGSNMDPDWSPDGHSLVYVSRRHTMGPVADALVMWSLGTGEEHVLWPDLGAFIEPRWSPDGGSVLVRGGDRRGVRGAWRLDARTGAILSSFGWVMCMEWAPDGRAFFSVPVESGRKTVQRTEVPSGRTREIYRDPAAGGAIFGVAVAPDGQSLAVSVGDAEGTRLLVVPASGGPAREVMRNPSQFRFLQQWTRDGASILFTRRTEKPTVVEELWNLPAAGGTPRSLNLARDRVEGVRVSPDGERIAFRTGRPFWDLWLMDNVLHVAPADGR